MMGNDDITGVKKLQLEYWTAFREYLLQHSKIVRPQKPQPQHWMTFGIGRSSFHLSTTANTRDAKITVALILNGSDSKTNYALLYEDKDKIESEVGEGLQWLELPDKKESRIQAEHNADPLEQSQWPEQHKWLCERLEAFHRTFAPRVKKLGV
jgi:hypothetical protein